MTQLSETTYEWGKRTLAEVLGAFNSLHSELLASRALLTAATERAEKAESQRDRMREALERIAASDTGEWFDAIRDKFVYCGKCQDKEYESSKALKEVGDE